MCYFVGGYYDDRIFENELYSVNLYDKKMLSIYTLREVLKLGFMEGVIDCYTFDKKESEKDFCELTEEEKAKVILDYIKDDELAGLKAFNNLNSAVSYLKECLDDIKDVESNYEFSELIQDEYGNFREKYILKNTN